MREIVEPAKEWACGCKDSAFVREGMFYDGGAYFCQDYVRESDQCARRRDEVTRG